ncbi:hypothetical protein GH733_000031 [Mirounga leonina]|nr:hypothetical protein GH733_000031 [Mirounga leonina]
MKGGCGNSNLDKIVRKAGNLTNAYVYEVGPGPGGITRSILNANVAELLVVEKDSRFIPGLQLCCCRCRRGPSQRLPLEARAALEVLEVGGAGHAGQEGIVVALYEEPGKPNSALDFLKHQLEAANPENPDTELLHLELAEMKEKYKAIVEENKKLNTKLAQYKPPEEGRLTANTGSKQRSRLSVMAQYLCNVQHILTIPGQAFVPKPERVHFIPTVEVQIPKADRTHARTMVARAACTWTGRDRMEYFRVQLNIPVLYHVQSIHSPCSCTMAVMMLEPKSTFTFQLGSRVAVSTPDTPDKARMKARSWSPADAMTSPLSLPTVTRYLMMMALDQDCSSVSAAGNQHVVEESPAVLVPVRSQALGLVP